MTNSKVSIYLLMLVKFYDVAIVEFQMIYIFIME